MNHLYKRQWVLGWQISRPAVLILLLCLWMAAMTPSTYAQDEDATPAGGDTAQVTTQAFRPIADTYV
ncbi:MAG: hypothetical protein R6W76_23180, partial [Caldilinea sp.]